MRTIYLDNNATTPLHPDVKEVMIEAMEYYGNPSSLHEFGRQARTLIEDARTITADFIGASPDEVLFTGSGSEANNTVIHLYSNPVESCTQNPNRKARVITTKIEHPCILEPIRALSNNDVDVVYLDVDNKGRVFIDQLKDFLKKPTILVSVMMANNEIGTIQDIKSLAEIAHEYGAFYHTDAVQAAGKIPIDVQELTVDFLSFSGHKMYGPKGVGVLYVRKGVRFCPLIQGGHQERGRRAGTENTVGIIGLGKTIELRAKDMQSDEARIKKLKLRLRDGLLKNISGILINGDEEHSIAGTLNIYFDGVVGEAMLLHLDLEGIAVSTGSACSSGSIAPSHVLLAAGATPDHARGSIRFSIGRENTQDEIDIVIEKMTAIVKKLRDMPSTYKR